MFFKVLHMGSRLTLACPFFPSSFALHLRYIDYLCSGQFLLRHIDYVTLHLLLTLHLHLRYIDSFLA